MKYKLLKIFLKEYCDLTEKTIKEALRDLTKEDVWYQEDLDPIFSAIAWTIETKVKTLVLSIQENHCRDIYYSFGTTSGIPLYIGTGKLPLFYGLSLSEIEEFLQEIVSVSTKNFKILREVNNG